MYRFEPELLPDEKILYRTRYHWIYYLRALAPLGVTFGLGSLLWALLQNEAIAAISLLFLVLSLFWFISKVLHARIVRAYVTNQRLIHRHGWARRHTVDVTLDRIGGVVINQDTWQRVFGHGTVKVILPVVEMILPYYLSSPTKFRCEITNALKKPPPPPETDEDAPDDDEEA
jgi:hypothetical protein